MEVEALVETKAVEEVVVVVMVVVVGVMEVVVKEAELDTLSN